MDTAFYCHCSIALPISLAIILSSSPIASLFSTFLLNSQLSHSTLFSSLFVPLLFTAVLYFIHLILSHTALYISTLPVLLCLTHHSTVPSTSLSSPLPLPQPQLLPLSLPLPLPLFRNRSSESVPLSGGQFLLYRDDPPGPMPRQHIQV